LLWWVPAINNIVYGHVRVDSNRSVNRVDRFSGEIGLDVAFHTAELVAYYNVTQELAGDARPQNILRHRFGGEVDWTMWVHRNHRLTLRLGGFIDPITNAQTIFFGTFWEGSMSRGLDDYSTPQINLPQQLGRGRGILRGEGVL
jgi:hypothetical protein